VKIGTKQKIFFLSHPKTGPLPFQITAIANNINLYSNKQKNRRKMKVLVADEDSGSIKGALYILKNFFFSSSRRRYLVWTGTNSLLIEIVFEKGTDTSQKTGKQPISTTAFGQLGRARYTQKLALLNGGKHVSHFLKSPSRLIFQGAFADQHGFFFFFFFF
jgi:hypothetical protein